MPGFSSYEMVCQEELKSASDEMMKTFLQKHGCDASVKDFTAFVRSQDEGEIEDNDAEEIAGGIYYRSGITGPVQTVI